MKFVKVCAGGADYILPEIDTPERLGVLTAHSAALCDRHTGIGAQGIICLCDGVEKNTLEVIMPNGRKRDFDADAAVCFAAVNGKTETVVKMPGGSLNIRKNGTDDIYDMEFGRGSFLPGDVPLACSYPVIEKAVEAGNRIVILTALRLGTSYAVHETYDLDKVNVDYLGERITKHSLFLKKADAVFVQRTADNAMRIVCFRRDVGRVVSDTGAAAAALAAMCRTGRFAVGVPADVISDREDVTAVCRRDNSVLLKTSAKVVFEGDIDL